jgi:hypothetical protein
MGYKNNDFPKHLIEKYQGIPYVMLDVPKFEPDDNFFELWNAHAIPIVRLKPDPRYPYTPDEAEQLYQSQGKTNEYTMPNWIGMNILDIDSSDDRWSRSNIDGRKLLPKFWQQLHDYIPALGFSQILFWSNQRPIGLHRDLHEQHPIPTSLRIMIHDENPEPTFWLQPLPEGRQGIGSEKLAFVPEQAKFVGATKTNSNAFVYNNGQWIHGAKKDPKYSKILCSISLAWDWKKYEQLLDRSIEKYGSNL